MTDHNPLKYLYFLISLARIKPTPRYWRYLLAFPVFGRFTLTDAGRKLSRELFSYKKIEKNNTMSIFANLYHSFDDEPALIDIYGTQQWYRYGELHRDGDQPAIVQLDGTMAWYQHDELHRDEDKPAVLNVDGTQQWYYHGLEYSLQW